VALTEPTEVDRMRRMGIYDQIQSSFQHIVAPEIRAVRADIQRLDEKVDGVDARLGDKINSLAAQMSSMKNELVSEIRRVDVRIDGMERELRVAIDIRERLAALEARRS
jgi:hypothetical protein